MTLVGYGATAPDLPYDHARRDQPAGFALWSAEQERIA
ncbi:MAG: hypothetical protein JWR89_4867 [Tardiphaga sp.]|nr:hypothetical protein [Tardiphaga sp.]